MQITVSARHTEVSPALRSAAEEKVGKLARFFDGIDQAEVHFEEEQNPRIPDKEICEITLQGNGHHIRCKVSAPDGFVAIDRAVDKLENQLHKLKTKIQRRHHNGDMKHRITKTKQFDIGEVMHPDEATEQMELLGHDFYVFTNRDTNRAAVVYRRDDGDVGLIDTEV